MKAMRHELIRAIIIALAATVLDFPAVAQKISRFTSAQVKVDAYRTYSWLPGRALTKSGLIENPPLTTIVQQAVDGQLKKRGYTRVESGGEFEIAFVTGETPGLQVESVGGWPELRWHVGNVPIVGRYFKAGTLAINLIDPKLKKSIFVAICSDTIDKTTEAEKKIFRAVEKAFQKFPTAQSGLPGQP